MSSYKSPQDIEKSLSLGGVNHRPNQIGAQVVRRSMRVAKGVYDFAVQGGAISTISLYDPALGKSQPLILPPSAIVSRVLIDVITAPTSGGSATIAVGTGVAVNDLKTATAVASFTGLLDGIPVNTAATSIKIASTTTLPGQKPSMTIATAALTAGKFNVHIEYYLSD